MSDSSATILGSDNGNTTAGERLEKRAAYFTCDIEYEQPSYYFAPVDRAPGPYRKQLEVKAILDIAKDGTLAGIELVWGKLPMPPKVKP